MSGWFGHLLTSWYIRSVEGLDHPEPVRHSARAADDRRAGTRISGRGKVTAIIMAILPILAGVMLSIVRPGHLDRLFHDPREAFGTGLGGIAAMRLLSALAPGAPIVLPGYRRRMPYR